jgi:hypothetical protein
MHRTFLYTTILVFIPRLFFAIGWTEHMIDSNLNGVCSVVALDIDGDSIPDVAGAAIYANCITWWQNDGQQPINWTEQTVATGFAGACDVYPCDVDGDGDIDIIGCAWNGQEVAWWSNDGGSPITWTGQTIDNTFTDAHEVFAADMDDDEDIDVLGASADLDEIAWFENDGEYPISWTKHVIDSTFDGARSVYATDINGDSLMDVVGAALLSHDVTVWLNNGDTTWTKQVIDGSFYGAHMIDVCDVDADGDSDILCAAYMANSIAWWRNNGDSTWTKQVIDNTCYNALGVYAADIDGDDDMDVLGTSDQGDAVYWYSNSNTVPITWTRYTVASGFDGAWPVHAADLDDDDDIDVLSCATYADDIAWFESDLTGVAEEHEMHAGKGCVTSVICGPLVLPQDRTYRLFDISGREADVRKLSPGIYFVEIEGQVVQKVVKVR